MADMRTVGLSEGAYRLPRNGKVLRKIFGKTRPHSGSHGPGCASGKQNIVEASQTSGTSKQAEIKLINVARASLEESLEDYLDFLRVRKLRVWAKDSKEALFVRKLGAQKNTSYRAYETYIETRLPEVVANILVCLIHQTNYLLDQLLRKLEKTFVEDGGLRERMTRARLSHRAQQSSR